MTPVPKLPHCLRPHNLWQILLLPLPEIPRGSLVIVEGRAPAPRPSTVCTPRPLLPRAADPRLGAVLVVSHNRE